MDNNSNNQYQVLQKRYEELQKRYEELEKAATYRTACRHFLMASYPEDATVDDFIEQCLEELGYGKNGLNFEL